MHDNLDSALRDNDQPLPSSELFLNRELSWLRFNERVLAQAQDIKLPLLERVNFLSIFGRNLDEFYMKRVGAMRRLQANGVVASGPDQSGITQQISAIRDYVRSLMAKADSVFQQDLLPALASNGIQILRWAELCKSDCQFCVDYFRRELFPQLTPLAVDAGHPFPLISNLSTSIGVLLSQAGLSEPLFARVKTSGVKPQWVELPVNQPAEDGHRFIHVREIIHALLAELFPGFDVISSMLFRVTRNADLELDEDDADDVWELLREELREIKFARVIRLEHGPDVNQWIYDFLRREFEIDAADIFEQPGELDYGALQELTKVPLPKLKYTPWTPVMPPGFDEQGSVFDLIKRKDQLVHHPYESFSLSVERFMREAVEDPQVVAIKMTVYRIGDETRIIPLLQQAALAGKQVVCLVEIKARFEEERNMQLAERLELAGAHVIFGIAGLKIHAKTLLVVRRESQGLRCYAHIGTGNYNSKTAELYTDLSLFTCRTEFTEELLHFFNFITGRSAKNDYQSLLVAPATMERRVLDMIEREIEHARHGRPAQIIAKLNNLEDKHVIEALYAASQNGVSIELFVRSVCCLRPGVQGLSDNIRVYSLVGRFLEHSRLAFFRNGQRDPLRGDFLLGSADWMERNLHRRVEVAAYLKDRELKHRCWQILQLLAQDRELSWGLLPNGEYHRLSDGLPMPKGSSQELLMRLAGTRGTDLLVL